ncbi:MAG: hypothetical protein IKH92_10270 [Clostridiales bacterium]|nr:hypothetical protein [Clostridiales bacterium]
MDTSKLSDERIKNLGEKIFFAMFIPWIVLIILAETTVAYNYSDLCYSIINVLKLFVLPAGMVVINLMFLGKNSFLKNLLLLSVFVMVMAQFCVVTYDEDLLLCTILVISSSHVHFKKLLKTYLLTSVSVAVITTILAVAGIIENIVNHQNGMTRYALGAIWCTDYSARVFYLLLITLYLYSRKMKIYHWVGLLAIVSVVFKFTFGKLDFVCMLLSIVIFFIHESIEKQSPEKKLRTSWEKIWEKLSPFFTPAAAALMTVLTLAYSADNRFLVKMSDMLSGRLYLGHRAFKEMDITLAGQNIKWIGMGGISNGVAPEGYNFVDCSYLNILFTFGIIVALAVIALHVFMAYKNRKDTAFILVIALISLNCIVAHHFIEVAYNPFWAALLAGTACAAAKKDTSEEPADE